MGGVLSEFLNDMKVDEDGTTQPGLIREDDNDESDVELYHWYD